MNDQQDNPALSHITILAAQTQHKEHGTLTLLYNQQAERFTTSGSLAHQQRRQLERRLRSLYQSRIEATLEDEQHQQVGGVTISPMAEWWYDTELFNIAEPPLPACDQPVLDILEETIAMVKIDLNTTRATPTDWLAWLINQAAVYEEKALDAPGHATAAYFWEEAALMRHFALRLMQAGVTHNSTTS